MCTVSYVPLGTNHYILTSNRDEKTWREDALCPRRYLRKGDSLYYPKDPHAGGTWFLTSSRGITLCLLNGAFKAHQRASSYRMSRGQLLLQFFDFTSTEDFLATVDLKDVEPFTLLIADSSSKPLRFFEMRWDGKRKFKTELDSQKPAIWSSSTLYDSETVSARQHLFDNWLVENEVKTAEILLDFHRFGKKSSEKTEGGFIIDRDNLVKTRSISSIERDENWFVMHHLRLADESTHTIRLLL